MLRRVSISTGKQEAIVGVMTLGGPHLLTVDVSAQKIFLKYYHFFNAIFLEPNPVPIKYCLKQAGIINSDAVRLPLSPLNESTQKILDSLLKEFQIV